MRDRWLAVRKLFESAIDLPAGERHNFVLTSDSDEHVRRQVFRLLENADRTGSFLETPPSHLAADVLGHPTHPPALAPGDLLANRFRIERFLGEGGMGEVYQVCDSQTRTSVALKTVHARILGDTDAMARLRGELLLARSVTHRNVCRVFDIHESFLTMELLGGETLARRLARTGPFTSAETGEIVRQLISGLAAAHDAGVIHGDLKPSNVMLEPTGRPGADRVVIMDFGIAVAAQTGLASAAGSPEYMAPEQTRRGDISPASDIYSLGIVVAEMLTGSRSIESAELPPEWKPLVRRCLSADPADRFQTASQALSAMRPRTRSFKLAAGFTLLVLLVAAAFCFLVGWPAPRSRPPAIAVLGFRNLSGNPQLDYLSLLFSVGLDADLGRTGKVRIIPAEDVARLKAELQFEDGESLSPETRGRVRDNLAADVLILGSWSLSPAGRIHLAVLADDARSGRQLAAVSAAGDENHVPALLSQAGSALRNQLRLAPVAGDADRIVGSLPGNLEAMRLYSEGLKQLRTFNALSARDSLQQAVAAEPDFALAHSALASAWASLGYDLRAEVEDRKALDLSSKLSSEDRLQIESDYWQRAHQPQKAIQAVLTLLRQSAENPDYLLRLASLQSGSDALATIRRIQAMPVPVRDDPRIDLADAEAADKASDFRREMAAASRAAQKAARSGALILEAQASVHLGWSAMILGQMTVAHSAYRRAEDLYTEVGDRNGIGTALRGLALVAEKQGALIEAQELLFRAVRIFHEIGALNNEALALNTRALVTSSRGRLIEAAALYNAALSICGQLQDARCSGRELNNMGYVLFRQGRLQEAFARLSEAVSRYKLARHSYGISFALSSLGDLLLAQGRFTEARSALEESIALSKQVGDRSSQASTEVSLAELLSEQDRIPEAEQLCRRAIAVEVSMGESDTAAKNALVLARMHLDAGQPASAETELRQALPVLVQSGRVDESARAQALYGEASALLGHKDAARKATEEALRLLSVSESQLARVNVLLAVARARYALGDYPASSKTLSEAAQRARQCGYLSLARRAANLKTSLVSR